jgi:hypothetical protein
MALAVRAAGRQRLRRSRVRAGGATASGRIVAWRAERGSAARQSGSWRNCTAGLTAAEDALTEAHAAMKRVEAAFDAASDAFTEAEQALDAAREQRARARRHGTWPGRRTNMLPLQPRRRRGLGR